MHTVQKNFLHIEHTFQLHASPHHTSGRVYKKNEVNHEYCNA